MYFLQFAQICKDVLAKLTEGLSTHAELRFVNVLAPQINEAYAVYRAHWTENFTATEGKLALAEAQALEKEAKELLTDAGISKERKLFLCELATNYVNLSSPLPNKLEHVENQVLHIYSSGFVTRLKKTAQDLKMSDDTIKLLSDIERVGKYIATRKASK